MRIPPHHPIYIDGDTWRILGIGASRNQQTYLHLASTTRFQEQRNGRAPVQITDWVDDWIIEEACILED